MKKARRVSLEGIVYYIWSIDNIIFCWSGFIPVPSLFPRFILSGDLQSDQGDCRWLGAGGRSWGGRSRKTETESGKLLLLNRGWRRNASLLDGFPWKFYRCWYYLIFLDGNIVEGLPKKYTSWRVWLESYIWKLFWWIMRPCQLWSQEKAKLKWEKKTTQKKLLLLMWMRCPATSVNILLIFQNILIYRQLISIFHQNDHILIFSRMSLLISIFSIFQYQHFQEWPYIDINIWNTPKMPPDSDHSLGWFESWFSDWARFCRDSLCAADKGCSAQVFIFLDDHLYKVEQLELANVLCLYLICLPFLSSPPLTLWIEQFDKRRRKNSNIHLRVEKFYSKTNSFPASF